MSDQSEQRLTKLGALWRRERVTTRERFVAERRATPLAERVRRGVALTGLHIDETDAAAGGRTLLWVRPAAGGDLAGVRVGPGDPVRLWWDDPDSPEAVRGVVARRSGGRLGVMVDGDVPDRLEEGSFKLDTDDPEATFDRGERALRVFRQARAATDVGRLREVLFGGRQAEAKRSWDAGGVDARLNGPQREAVELAMRAWDVALIHGPPGTGKTTTLAEIVARAVAQGERVLATAASNAAVDNLAERLIAAGLTLVRVGHPARVSPAVEARTLDALVAESEAAKLAKRWVTEANAIRRRVWAKRGRGALTRREAGDELREAGRLQRDARQQLRGAQQVLIDGAQVIAATAAGADAALLGEAAFDLVVLDEATQAADPIALVALRRAKRVVMAGDPHQLPPTVLDLEAERGGLGTTVFERLAAERPEVCRMLEVQHRMHAALMAFPSASKYQGRLRAAPAVAAHRLEDLPGVATDPLRPGPLVFLDAAGRGWEEERREDDPSTTNPGHADRVAAEARRLLGRGLPAADLAIITPYWAQVRLLRDLLPEAVEAGLEIGTVDGFQGREKEAVIVDLVRSNGAREIGFLADTRRMNVALTRARRFLLVLGDSATLGGHAYYDAFMQAAEEGGAWLSAWSDEAPEFEG
jgi:hypothetical protein